MELASIHRGRRNARMKRLQSVRVAVSLQRDRHRRCLNLVCISAIVSKSRQIRKREGKIVHHQRDGQHLGDCRPQRRHQTHLVLEYCDAGGISRRAARYRRVNHVEWIYQSIRSGFDRSCRQSIVDSLQSNDNLYHTRLR